MKRRLYYVANNLDTVDEVADLLHRQGITDWNFHLVCKDEAGLYRHHLHSATPLLTNDVWRNGERGLLFGLIGGIVLSLLIIGGLGYFTAHPLIAAAVIIVIAMMHGAWIGGLAGMGNENYKIKRFHNDIEAGKALLMIDVGGAMRERVERALSHLPLEARGEDTVFAFPFSFGHGERKRLVSH